MATGNTTTNVTEPAFNTWLRSLDDPTLALAVVKGSPTARTQWIEIDIRTLPERQDLTDRIPPPILERLLFEAQECQRGNFQLDSRWPNYGSPIAPPTTKKMAA